MDYELIFWIITTIVGVIGFALLMARANRDQYVEWVGDCR